MSRFRMYPTPAQTAVMLEHCRHARFVWNLALEQANLYRPHWGPTPGHTQRCRQLTEARTSFDWLRAGSVTVQQQALRDFDQAMRNWWAGTHCRPTWRKASRHEGFRQIHVTEEHVERLNRRWGRVWVPKVGWVRFRWTRPPGAAKSYRVTRDGAGRWHIAFSVIPRKVAGPGDGSVVGVDRGVVNSVALSTGERTSCPRPDQKRAARLQRGMARRRSGSNRRARTRVKVARIKAIDADRRKDWAEKLSTELARRFDIVRIEDLNIRAMTASARGTIANPGSRVRAKAGLNRAILASGWGLLEARLADKIGDRLERVPPAYTSQACSTCGHRHKDSRESQARFVCRACGTVEHADVNAARNIAAGRAVTGREAIPQTADTRAGGALASNRQPQLVSSG